MAGISCSTAKLRRRMLQVQPCSSNMRRTRNPCIIFDIIELLEEGCCNTAFGNTGFASKGGGGRGSDHMLHQPLLYKATHFDNIKKLLYAYNRIGYGNTAEHLVVKKYNDIAIATSWPASFLCLKMCHPRPSRDPGGWRRSLSVLVKYKYNKNND